MKTLRPIHDYDKYHQHILQVLEFELYFDLFRPLFDILGYKLGKENEPVGSTEVRFGSRWNKVGSAVEQALSAGKISYVDGYVYGAFNAVIARELRSLGASFDAKKKAYKLSLSDMPVELRTAAARGRMRLEEQARALAAKIDEASQRSLTVDLGKYVKNVTGSLEEQFVRTVKPSLEVPMDMSPGLKNQIEEDYINNVNLYISGWRDEQIERLRWAVQENVKEGFRADKMARVLEAEYGVTRKRARFIARQETSLLVSRYRQLRYTEAGLNEYIWSTSGDERVRQDHKDLNKRRFSWDSPPVVDKATGRREHPGCDFGCRCIAIPVMRTG
jgi:SPP1 gp7 family putative phage head morphogenesis protein